MGEGGDIVRTQVGPREQLGLHGVEHELTRLGPDRRESFDVGVFEGVSRSRAQEIAVLAHGLVFGGALVTSCSSRSLVTAATASTASSKASALAWDGLVEPLILRTYCRAEAWISSSVAGGSKLWRVRMFLHMAR